MKTIRCLVTSLIRDKKDEEITRVAINSLQSKDCIVDVTVDSTKYRYGLAEAWEKFFEKWRHFEYDYLLWMSNDCVLHPKYIDYMVRYLESKAPEDVGIVSAVQTNEYLTLDVDWFPTISPNMYTTALVFRQGVIEKVGCVDFQFPIEYIDRDYLYRAKLEGIRSVSLDMQLIYHPPYSHTVGNDEARLLEAREKYILKWGGDALQEVFKKPYNSINENL